MLDTAKVELPLFVAADQKRIPPITIDDTDLCSIATAMMEMKSQFKEMAMAQKKLVDTVTGIQKNIHVKSYVADVPFPPLPSNPVSVQPVLVDSIAVPNPVVRYKYLLRPC